MSLLASLLLGLTFTGCNSGHPETSPVTGTVTCNGEPAAGVEITFTPQGEGGAGEGSANSGRNAVGVTDAQGNYTLQTFEEGDGALVGEHQVRVLKPVSRNEQGEIVDEGSSFPCQGEVVSKTVAPDQANRIDIDLGS